MDLFKFKTKLCKYGKVEIVKEGIVFILLLIGTGLSNGTTVVELQQLILEYAGDRYPNVEAMKNEDSFFFIALKPKD